MHPRIGAFRRAVSLAALCMAVAAAPALGQLAKRHGKPADSGDKTAADPLMPPQYKQYPVGATWVLKSFNDKPVPLKDDLTFMIDSNYRGSGYSGCNTWSATIYPVKGQKFLVGPIATTRKQCDKPTMEFEHNYLSAIAARPSWDLVNGDLVMKLPNESLVFQRSL